MAYLCTREGVPISGVPVLSEEQKKAAAEVIAKALVKQYRSLIVQAVAEMAQNGGNSDG